MNRIDYSNPGGFPLDCDVLEFDRQALTDGLGAYAQVGGSANMIISGMKYGPVGMTNGILDGWCMINGELLRFNASVIPGLTLGEDLYIKINEGRSSLVFEDLTARDVVVTRYCTLVKASTTGTPAGHYPFSTFVPWGKFLGDRHRTGWVELWNVASGADDIYGTVYYMKDSLTNTVLLRGNVSVLASLLTSDTTGTPLYRTIGAVLPVEARPAFPVPFKGLRRYHSVGMIKDYTGTSWLNDINMEVRDSGHISCGFIRPDAAVSSYTVEFFVPIPLS